MFNMCFSYVILNHMDLIILITLILLMNCVEFCMKEVFKCRDWRMMRWVEERTKAQAWGCPAPQEISKKYKRQSLGMPPRHPFFIGKNQVTFQNTIFLLLHALRIFLGASVFLCFQFSLVLFAAINGWTPTNFLWRRCTRFHLQRML